VSTLKVYIVAVGDELLSGRVLDYNTHWIAKRLSGVGFNIVGASIVPDDKEEIVEAVRRALSKADLTIITGGLGPTPGDITLEALAEALNRNLSLNDDALEMVKDRYRELYEVGHIKTLEMTPEREKMARIPEGGTPIFNAVGIAPGVMVEHQGKVVLALPGVPSEMMYLLEKALPSLERMSGPVFVSVEDTVDVGDESVIARALREVMAEFPEVSIKSYPSGFGGKVKMRIIASMKAEDREGAGKHLREAIRKLKEKLV